MKRSKKYNEAAAKIDQKILSNKLIIHSPCV